MMKKQKTKNRRAILINRYSPVGGGVFPVPKKGEKMDDKDDIIDFQRFRRLLGISEAALRIRINKKKVPEPFRIGRRLYWKRSEIDRWIEEQRERK